MSVGKSAGLKYDRQRVDSKGDYVKILRIVYVAAHKKRLL